MPTFIFDPTADDFDGNDDIQLSAVSGGLLAYLSNRDAVSITDAGGVIADGTWRDEIGGGDALRIDFTQPSIETVEIEFKRLGAGERVTAEVRDGGGALLGSVAIPGQGTGSTSVFTATIDQDDLDTSGAIASIELSRDVGGTNFVVGTISATVPGQRFVFDPEADDFDGNDDIQLSAIRGGQLGYLANRDAVSITNDGGVIDDGTWRDEIGRDDELRIDFKSSVIESVEIELKRLGAGERVIAEVRDNNGGLLGEVTITGRGNGATSVFTATIGQDDLDTSAAIGSIVLSRDNGSTNFLVGTIAATEGNFAPSIFSLADLDGDNGFRLDGIDEADRSGSSVASAGDVNGDGFDDVIVGAPFAYDAYGESYVVFGQAGGFGAAIDLAALDGDNGFRLEGVAYDSFTGTSVASAGDVNGDGFDDLMTGAPGAFYTNYYGGSFVVFGQDAGFGATVDLADLDGNNGFVTFRGGFREFGYSVDSAGDINGDGFDDMIVGSPQDLFEFYGSSFIIFGQDDGFPADLDADDLGSSGFGFAGRDYSDTLGLSVSSAGDFNGDGFDDLIVGAPGADPFPTDYGSASYSYGESYLVFGAADISGVDLDSLDGDNGFRLDGIEAFDFTGFSVDSAGDVNGDGFDDVVVGAFGGAPGGARYAGQSYVVFGAAGGFSAALDLAALDGDNGFRLDGAVAFDESGVSVSSAGDVNGDGFDDVLIGADGVGFEYTGAAYVLYGKEGAFDPSIDLGGLDGINGFRIDGIERDDMTGRAVNSAGDINGDGFDDLIIGAPTASPDGVNGAGQSYVFFGGDFRAEADFVGDDTDNTLVGTAADEILVGGLGDDTLLGNGGADSLQGGFGGDILGIGDDTFLKADGGGDDGTGNGDTLRLLDDGMDLDLTMIANNRVVDIETIDMDGAGANILTLDISDVLDSSTSTNTLTVLGDSSDALVADFSGLGATSASVDTITIYTIGAGELVVDNEIDQSQVVI